MICLEKLSRRTCSTFASSFASPANLADRAAATPAHLVAREDRFLTASPLKKKRNGIGLITQAIRASNKPAYWKPMLCCMQRIC